MRIVRMAFVKEMTGLSRAAVYRKMSAGEFPQSVNLGPKTVGWVEEEVALWVEERVKARPVKAAA